MRTPMMAEVGSRQINHVVALSYVSIALALKNLGESLAATKPLNFSVIQPHHALVTTKARRSRRRRSRRRVEARHHSLHLATKVG